MFLDLLDVGGADFSKTNWIPDRDYSPSSSSIYIDALRSLDSDINSDFNAANGKIDETVDPELMNVIEKICQAGVDARKTLNGLDRECGDGDAGDTLATACHAILNNLQYFSVSNVDLAFRRIARCLTNAVGGTSGPLYAVFFIRAAVVFSTNSDSNNSKDWKSLPNWVDAIQNGISGIEELGGCSRGDRTLLDALYPVLDVLKNISVDGEIGIECLVQAAMDGAENTRNMKAQAGRARYVEGKGVGEVDPGAFAVYLLLKALV
jgi:dihydroxyacetone kinase